MSFEIRTLGCSVLRNDMLGGGKEVCVSDDYIQRYMTFLFSHSLKTCYTSPLKRILRS